MIRFIDLVRDPSKLDAICVGKESCASCGIRLQEAKTGRRWTSEGNMCSDCYYAAVGKGIEEHPIVTAGVRKG